MQGFIALLIAGTFILKGIAHQERNEDLKAALCYICGMVVVFLFGTLFT